MIEGINKGIENIVNTFSELKKKYMEWLEYDGLSRNCGREKRKDPDFEGLCMLRCGFQFFFLLHMYKTHLT